MLVEAPSRHSTQNLPQICHIRAKYRLRHRFHPVNPHRIAFVGCRFPISQRCQKTTKIAGTESNFKHKSTSRRRRNAPRSRTSKCPTHPELTLPRYHGQHYCIEYERLRDLSNPRKPPTHDNIPFLKLHCDSTNPPPPPIQTYDILPASTPSRPTECPRPSARSSPSATVLVVYSSARPPSRWP